jgi:NADH-quinone oxidoreductase subunit G
MFSMAKITIDHRVVETREGIPVLEAALEAGWDVPHYCYHPGLSIVASCRLCLMEMQMPHPQTREMTWSPKLVPSCQTPVRDGLVVRFDSDVVRKSREQCMEFFLLNHPLDCPVCDQAGECWLQDYSFGFGRAESRMVDPKLTNPKKDIGPKTLLYQDRCVMCTRCVRFTDEISGTRELCVVNRGARAEIDVFPGMPLDNPLQGNVVDLCPVGSLLDKDFLFKRRVWELEGTASVCPGCATGCAIRVDHADDTVYRLKPRYNPKVNDWWMCDEGRFGFKYVHDKKRIHRPRVRRGAEVTYPAWDDVPDVIRFRFADTVQEHGDDRIAAVLSPFMACEEAWLLIRFIQELAPRASLFMGPVPTRGDDERFPVGAADGQVKFTISREKCPNRRGIETLLEYAGVGVAAFEQFVKKCAEGAYAAAWVVGGYPSAWIDAKSAEAIGKVRLLVVQDMFESDVTGVASIILPACAWVEREGSFMNAAGGIQSFRRAIHPPDGARADGQYLFELAGFQGLFSGRRVRELMAATLPQFAGVLDAPLAPAHAY